MMHITEDTPPDMLVGAMDLTVHLPNGNSVKMSVERSTPMMDLLVQITTNQHLQLSGYIIQALGMAPSADRGDKILPYKPNTPIGALDTQHVKVVPKGRTLPTPKNLPPGHQPFESTFRLKVHLPRNQLYVCRVSRHVRLEEIMRKVCDEKGLDAAKYEFRHPGNLDEVLDYKLTLSDYQITEIYVVARGTVSLTQTFSSSDIMALRKEEERKQMAAKTGGGVFNLIFKRGKANRSNIPVAPEIRPVSPLRSDESRSETPPAPQQQIIPTPPPPADQEKPKPPVRKRRPAPKPPQKQSSSEAVAENSSAENGSILEMHAKKLDNGLTICHSRNSSDSSGFHETSVLSENCTLPRRPKAMCESHSQSVSNLDKMSMHSKSTSSLSHAGRKKRAAPLPPAVAASSSVTDLSKPSPLVASQSVENDGPPIEHAEFDCVVEKESEAEMEKTESGALLAPVASEDHTNTLPPKPTPRIASKTPPKPKPRFTSESETKDGKTGNEDDYKNNIEETKKRVEFASTEEIIEEKQEHKPVIIPVKPKRASLENILAKTEKPETNPELQTNPNDNQPPSPPQVIAALLKSPEPPKPQTNPEPDEVRKSNSSASLVQDNLDDIDVEMFSASLSRNSKGSKLLLRHMLSMQDFEPPRADRLMSITSLQSVDSLSNLLGTMTKWSNLEDLDDISDKWVVGGNIRADSISSALTQGTLSESTTSLQPPSYTPSPPCSELSSISGTSQKQIAKEPEKRTNEETQTIVKTDDEPTLQPEQEIEEEVDWQYQLPSPPKAFRDLSPPNLAHVTLDDTVISSPELIEKLNNIKDSEIETVATSDSTVDDEDKKICSKLSLEHLEKRKTLVYNRELSTSLKMSETETIKKSVVSELEDTLQNYTQKTISRKNSNVQDYKNPTNANLPNFVITTYDAPKKQINIFEDETVHSNKDASSKRSSLVDSTDSSDFTLRKHSYTRRSMENIAVDKQPEDVVFKKPFDVPRKTNGNSSFVTRSGSFSTDSEINGYKGNNPVKRSKSQLILIKGEGKWKEDGMKRTGSSFDVSGLQSLEVMRLIQNKLNTPTNSSENLTNPEVTEKSQQKQEVVTPIVKPEVVVKPYRVAPAVNFSTWSERPKRPVSLKDDTDYKIKLPDTSKTTINVINTTQEKSDELNIKTDKNSNNVSIKVNGIESIGAPKSGNVVIKIGASNEVITRKPFGNVNGRPHSVAFDSNYEISRLPVVRSVELKKPFKDMHINKTVTQIYPSNETNGFNAFSEDKSVPEKSQDTLRSTNFNMPIPRFNSFAKNSVPVVRGFKSSEIANNRNSWTPSVVQHGKNFEEINKVQKDINTPFGAVKQVSTPFGDVILRSTANNFRQPNEKLIMKTQIVSKPQKVDNEPEGDSRSELLSAIRNFGGKKGLRSVKIN